MLQGRALFCWYVREDVTLRAALDSHLRQLRREGILDAIDEDLAAADVVMLLVSAAFLASEESRGEEMVRLMARVRVGAVRVIVALIDDADCSGTPFASAPFFPLDVHCRPAPIGAWEDREQALASITRGIRAACLGPLVRSGGATPRRDGIPVIWRSPRSS